MSPEDLDAVATVIAEAVRDAQAPLLERLTVLETRLGELAEGWASIGTMRERLAVVEEKAHHPPAPIDVTPVLERLANKLRGECAGVVGEVMKDVVALRIQTAVLEARAPVPGPAGHDGTNGTDGTNGKDGADGLGFEDAAVSFDGDRTLAFRLERGDRAKVFPIVLPFLRYQGVFQDGKSYEPGDVVTWAGSSWHCTRSATHTKPGDGAEGWTLIVKRGRDGKDGVDAPGALPVVKAGGGR